MVVERNLAQEGLSRHDLGREKFFRITSYNVCYTKLLREAIGCISDVANLYAKSYNMDAGVVFGLMRDNVDSSNFFNTDISHMCYALGPAVAKHAILKVTNPEKATEIENKYLADNSKRIENNYSQKSEENPASSGMVELSPYHNKANAEYSYMQKLFAKGYNSASTDAEKAKRNNFV